MRTQCCSCGIAGSMYEMVVPELNRADFLEEVTRFSVKLPIISFTDVLWHGTEPGGLLGGCHGREGAREQILQGVYHSACIEPGRSCVLLQDCQAFVLRGIFWTDVAGHRAGCQLICLLDSGQQNVGTSKCHR